MNTLIPWRFSPLSSLAVLATLYLLARLLLIDIHRFVARVPAIPGSGHVVRTTSLWLFCLSGLFILASPGSLLTRGISLLMLAMLFRMAVCDALTGLLLRRDTLAFLIAGLCAGAILDTLSLVATVLSALLCAALHLTLNRRQERLGRGDLILFTGLSAWCGPQPALQTAFAGTAAFILWHSTWRVPGRIEGPLGPWLALATAVQQLFFLYQPVQVTP